MVKQQPTEKAQKEVNLPKFWEPKSWVYSSQGSDKELIVTEGTAAECYTYESKIPMLKQDAAADWLISNKVVSAEDKTSLNLVKANELGLTFPDKVALLHIIKLADGLSIIPLDNRDAITTKHFEIYHEDSLTRVTLNCEDPPYNHRSTDFDDTATALIEISKQNVVISWEEFSIENVRLGQTDLDRIPYFVADVAIKHFSQLITRIPKKKKLLRQSDG